MTAQSELEARYLVNALGLIAHQLEARAHGGTLVTIGGVLAYDSADGERVLPLPVDYLAWTNEVARFLDNAAFATQHKTVLVTGTATMRSQQELTERGWNIVVDASKQHRDRLASRSEPSL